MKFRSLAAGVTAFGTLMATAALAAPSGTVAFLMPDQASTRYEEQDAPVFTAEIAKLCADCKVIYQNANGDVSLQQQQFNAMLTQGAKVIVLDPVDSAAAGGLVALAQSQGVKVVAYDRPIPDHAADYYVSFDNEGIGYAIGQSLVEKLKADGVPEGAGVLQINGSPTDAAAGLIRDGARRALAESPFKTLAEFDTPAWVPARAQEFTAGQITRFGDEIKGVLAANDGTGGGAIAAFKAAGAAVPPVTGNDATIAALQLIIAGDQYNTISKPAAVVAAAAAEVVVTLLNGETPEPKTSLYNTPSELFVPAVVTRENIKAEIFDTGIQTAAEICTGEYAAGCAELGIQ